LFDETVERVLCPKERNRTGRRRTEDTIPMIRFRRTMCHCACILFASGLVHADTDPKLGDEEWKFLTLVNRYREQNGAPVLQVSVALQKSSEWMSQDMARKNYFSHTDSRGRNPFQRMAAFGYSHSPAAENIGAGKSRAEAALTQWKTACDPDAAGACTYAHRRNMLNPNYKVIGIGRAYDAGSKFGWYWTTDFGGVVDQVLHRSESKSR
jgi:uncharacterized protein YkwD